MLDQHETRGRSHYEPDLHSLVLLGTKGRGAGVTKAKVCTIGPYQALPGQPPLFENVWGLYVVVFIGQREMGTFLERGELAVASKLRWFTMRMTMRSTTSLNMHQ